MQRVLFTAAAYILVVFPIAYVWHLVLFEEQYMAFGYFDGEPNVPTGFLTITIQGVILGMIYPLFRTKKPGLTRAFHFMALMGVFFWTSHVLAFVAKQQVSDVASFMAMETGYIAIKYGLFALLLERIHRGSA